MYYTSIFLAGEWGKQDFTILGKIICIVYCLIGIALFAIPTGTIFESFGDVLAEGEEVGEVGAESEL